MRKLPKFNTFIYTGTFVFIFTMQIILSGNDLMKYFHKVRVILTTKTDTQFTSKLQISKYFMLLVLYKIN